MTEVPFDTSSWRSLPRNLSLWLSGHKSSSGIPCSSGLESLAKSYSVSFSLEEMSPGMQELMAENALLRARLGEGVPKAEIASLLKASSENLELKRKLTQPSHSMSPDAELAKFSYEIIQKQTQELKKIIAFPDDVTGDPESMEKNLNMLGVLSYYWENYTAMVKSTMKNSLRSSQFSVFCMLATSAADRDLLKEAKDTLFEVDQVIIQDEYNLPVVFSCLEKLETLKLKFMQADKENPGPIDLKEPILKQKELISSCLSFLKEKKIDIASIESSDWSIQSLAQGFNIQERLLQVVFAVSKPITLATSQETALDTNQETLNSVFKEGKDIEVTDRSFHVNLEVIKQLTSQNKDLLSLLLENHSNENSKMPQGHFESRKELEDERTSSLASSNSSSMEKLINENFLLRKNLEEMECEFVSFKKTNPDPKFVEEQLSEKEVFIRNLMHEKEELNECIDRLKRNVHSLDLQVKNQKTVKEQYRALNLMHTERENSIVNMRQDMERQKLRAQASLNENDKKNLGLIKAIDCLTQLVRHYQPSFEGFQYITDLGKETEKEIGAFADKIQGQLNEMTLKCHKLEQELADTQGIVRKQQIEIDDRIQIMLEIAEEVDLRNKKIALETEVNKLTSIVQDLETETSDLKEEVRVLVQDNDQLSKDIQLKDQIMKQFETQIEELKKENSELVNIVQEIRSENSSLKDNIQELNTRIESYIEKERMMMHDIESIRNEHEQKIRLLQQQSKENKEIPNSEEISSPAVEGKKTKSNKKNKHLEEEPRPQELTPKKDNQEKSSPQKESPAQKAPQDALSDTQSPKKSSVKKESPKKKEKSDTKKNKVIIEDLPQDIGKDDQAELDKSSKNKETPKKKKKQEATEEISDQTSNVDSPKMKNSKKEGKSDEKETSKTSKKESSKSSKKEPSEPSKKESSKTNKKNPQKEEVTALESPKKELSKSRSRKGDNSLNESPKKQSTKKETKDSSKTEEKKSKSKADESKKTKKPEESKEKTSRSKKSKA